MGGTPLPDGGMTSLETSNSKFLEITLRRGEFCARLGLPEKGGGPSLHECFWTLEVVER
jgi:hypothetical protein